jgi:hypothetical protein
MQGKRNQRRGQKSTLIILTREYPRERNLCVDSRVRLLTDFSLRRKGSVCFCRFLETERRETNTLLLLQHLDIQCHKEWRKRQEIQRERQE